MNVRVLSLASMCHARFRRLDRVRAIREPAVGPRREVPRALALRDASGSWRRRPEARGHLRAQRQAVRSDHRPLAFASYNVPVANALLDLHDGAVGKGSLNPHVRELAILVACRETNYNLEWNGHEPAAVKAGVDAKVIDAVRTGGALTGLDDADAAVIRFGRELIGDRKMSSATFAKAVQLYGKKGAMDLVAVMSTYAVSGFYAIAVDEHPPAGKPALPALKK